MGSGSSSLSGCTPKLILGDADKNITAISCNDKNVLILNDTKTVTLLGFDGGSLTKEFSLQPSCCCSTSTGGWVIGFKTGQISELDSNLNILLSYRLPGSARAHEAEITHVRENADTESKKCHLISIASDGTCNLWGHEGRHIFCFSSQNGLSAIESSPFFAFLADKKGKFYTVSVDSLTSFDFLLPSPARCITSLGEGFACLAALQNGSVAVLSSTNVIDVFEFERKLTKVMPLALEEGTGLIVYFAIDEEGKLVICALDYILEEIGEGASLFATNTDYIVTILNDKIAVFSRNEICFKVLDNLIDVGLPRKEIAEVLMRQG